MTDIVFTRDTAKRRVGDRVSFDEASAARIVERGDAEYASGTIRRSSSLPDVPALKNAWGVEADLSVDSAGE